MVEIGNVDLANSTIVNTAEVRSFYEQPNLGNFSTAKPGVYEIPFYVSKFHVPRPDSKREANP